MVVQGSLQAKLRAIESLINSFGFDRISFWRSYYMVLHPWGCGLDG